ncbi:MAG: SGNH/GDSL hydrolase family protein [Spirochaetota bacterium]
MRTIIICCIFLVLSSLAEAQSPKNSGEPALPDPENVRLILPPFWYAVADLPMSIYYDNIILAEDPAQYTFTMNAPVASKSEARCWTIMPSEKDAGEHVVTVTVADAQGKERAHASMTLRIAPKNAGSGRNMRLLMIGDSLTMASVYPNEVFTRMTPPDNPALTMLGTHRPPSVLPGVAHEGYGGWAWNTFLTKYEPNPDGTYKKRSSPFIFHADGAPMLDIPRYIAESCGGIPPDVVTIHLGVNDCFGVSTNADDTAAVDARIDVVFADAEKFITAFRAAAQNARFGIGITTPPNAREEGFAASYKGAYHRWGWKRVQHRLIEREIRQFSGREQEGLHLIPVQLCIDPIGGYPTDNGVHPNTDGYRSMGRTFYAWLKWQVKR